MGRFPAATECRALWCLVLVVRAVLLQAKPFPAMLFLLRLLEHGHQRSKIRRCERVRPLCLIG
jgi:hypothetical protein